MSPAAIATPPAGEEKRKLKILMLHGFTQNGKLFHAKTRALEKQLIKAFPATAVSPLKDNYPGGVELLYPTGPILLEPADIPGFDVKAADGVEREAYGWWKRETGTELFHGFDEGLAVVAKTIQDAGGVDGVIGFSQGGAEAGFVASLLEEGRKASFEKNENGIKFPASFEGLQDRPLKFAVSYSGFKAEHDVYQALYQPKIKTPMLHVIGSLDSVVEESRCIALAKSCEQENIVYHPGGHFVPIGKEMVGNLVGFIRGACEKKKEEESVEDMDMPF
ncbi:serine hydrolase [Phlyctema vagabunda]|uniref:Serine hydrolase n=1 Tax=Phlyctema vagabunda TaxID=108571 RepID=A0ABR4P9F8_9HELO